jgi:hypothetical protein
MRLSMDVQRVARDALRTVWLGSLMLSVAQNAGAQEASRLRVAVHASASSEAPPDLSSTRSVVAGDGKRKHPILLGAGIGSLLGVGVGLGYAVFLNATNECKLPAGSRCTNDEAGLEFIVLPIYGAFFGSIDGALVGAIAR